MIPFDIKDLAVAYRKVKVDLFYSGNPCRIALSEFEDNLLENLKKIETALNNRDKKFLFGKSKGYWLCPKEIVFSKEQNKPIRSDLNIDYLPNKVKELDLRIIEHLPIAFHVITTLWINKIGVRYDQNLSPSAYGNRIRRHNDDTPNMNALGTFNPYLYHYRTWRDNGLKAIRTSLENGKRVIAITADFTAFYHNLNADFIVSEEFQKRLGVSLNKEEQDFTRLVVQMLNCWAKNTPIQKGLPVGCSISAVIANASLALLDKKIESEIIPLYYGRYVDDIILVLENTNDFKNQDEVWNWIENRIHSLSNKGSEVFQDNEYQDNIVYDLESDLGIDTTEKSNLYLKKDKTKVFLLDPPSGLAFLHSLEHQIEERSSEWRSLPELPEDKYIASMLLSACNKTGEEADNLRKADSLSTKRAAFAMKLRDFESYCRNLPQDCWKEQRKAFLDTISSSFTNLNSFFELFRYFPRILSIATECANYEFVLSIAKKIYENCCAISNINYTIAKTEIESNREIIFASFLDYIRYSFCESVISSIAFPVSDDFIPFFEKFSWLKEFGDVESIKLIHRDLSGYDLANKPFRYFSLYKQLLWPFDQKGVGRTYFYSRYGKQTEFIGKPDFNVLLWLSENCAIKFHDSTNNKSIPRIPQAWMFPTRPFSMPELYLCIENSFYKSDFISSVLCVLRGYAKQQDSMPMCYKDTIHNVSNDYINIQNTHISSSINVALSSWKTEDSSWIASVCKKEDPDLSRYRRLSHLLNHVLATHIKIDYLVLPELSIPLRWFLGLAYKLKNRGISLIGGVEYLHRENGKVSNQVWCSLLHDGLGFSQSVIVKQDKVSPAIHEESDLKRIAGIKLDPEDLTNKCAIIRHGDFCFGILICSELTNIDYRAKFRGCVDAIFVPEWNQDTEMFGSLIEAAAYDVHAYIIQCNDRRYGDTRIRIPAKQHYDRDIVKIKGGEEDYFVIGKLDINKLRQFQSNKISPTGESAQFKPVPVGFVIAPYRECLPKKNEDKH